MQCRPEDPNTLRLDEEVLEVGPGGRLRRKQPRGRQKMVDPLHELFLPPDPTKIGALVSVSHTFMHKILMRMCQYRAQCIRFVFLDLFSATIFGYQGLLNVLCRNAFLSK